MHLANALELFPANQLTTLDITCTQVSDDGIKALSKALSTYQQFKSLSISGNNIAWPSVLILARDLVQCPQLKSLDLSYSIGAPIDDNSAFQLSNVLAGAHKLSILKLHGYRISSRAIEKFLTECKALCVLGLRGNNISYIGLERLVSLVKRLPNFADFDMRPDAGVDFVPYELSRALLQNKMIPQSALMLLLCAARNRKTKRIPQLPVELYSHMFTFFNDPPGTYEDNSSRLSK